MTEVVTYESKEDVLRPTDCQYHWGALYISDDVLRLYISRSDLYNMWLVPNIFEQFCEVGIYHRIEIYLMSMLVDYHYDNMYNIAQYLRLWSKRPTRLFIPIAAKGHFVRSLYVGTWAIDGETKTCGDLGAQIRSELTRQQHIADDPLDKQRASKANLYAQALTIALGIPRAKKPNSSN